MKINELREKAITMLQMDTGLFVKCVNELDAWNGFADEFRCWLMDEIDEFYYDQPASKLLQDLTDDFNINDSYFYFTIWGLKSTDDIEQLYYANTTPEDVLDALIENYSNISIWGYEEFEEILEELANEG